MPSFIEELMGTVDGEIVVTEGMLFRSRYDLSDEYRTMLFGSGRRGEVARALINPYCPPKGITKRQRIQSLVKTGDKPSDLPKPAQPRPMGPAAGAPKAPAPVSVAAIPTPSAGVEEGKVLVGETLLSLRGGDIPGGSSAPPADKELEMLEGLNFDEPDKLLYFVLRVCLVCL
jgi:hypothetical protein